MDLLEIFLLCDNVDYDDGTLIIWNMNNNGRIIFFVTYSRLCVKPAFNPIS